ncbi:MAG TPA: hypothetical protein VFS20_26900 [Longimicrobium sp.]|nr:hypothetical protein [Longimicrobium sp.]
MQPAATLETVRRAVRGVVERTPELRGDAMLRRRIAENMVRVCATAAGLMEEEDRLTDQIARRVQPGSSASSDSASTSAPSADSVDRSTGSSVSPDTPAVAAGMAADASAGMSAGDGTTAVRTKRRGTLAAGQAAGDIHRRTAVNSAAGVLRATKDAIDFPGFVTSLISGVFGAMTTSTIQQLQAYADLLGAVGMSTSQFASSSITSGRAMDWVAQRFPAFRVVVAEGQPPRLELNDDADMPDSDELKSALDATDDEVSTIDDSELEETLVPLVKRKLARERQAMLSTMLLMGMNRIVVDDGRIKASMELQVDARSTAEQTTGERFDTRVTTGGSASFGMGMWGASANMQATVGYVKSDDQFSREDIALRAGLRSSVDIGFHTEPIALDRMANAAQREHIKKQSMVPETEHKLENLLTKDERSTTPPKFDAIPQLTPTPAPDPNSDEARKLREKKDFTVKTGAGGDGSADKPADKPAEKAAGEKAPAEKASGGKPPLGKPAGGKPAETKPSETKPADTPHDTEPPGDAEG